MSTMHLPVVLAQNLTASVRLLGLVGLFMVFMWEATVMTHSSRGSDEQKHTSCIVKRTAQKVGFHRDIVTTLTIPETALPNLEKKDGHQIFIKEYLPPGLYADLNEIKAAQDFGGPQVYCDVDIDVEKPAHLSPAHTIQVFTQLNKTGQLYHSAISLPIHLRYHKPSSEHSHHPIQLQTPDIYLNVTDSLKDADSDEYEQYVCDSSGHMLCTWQKLVCDFEPGDGILEFSMPVGQTDHSPMVVSLTLVITILSTLFLAYSIFSKKQINKNKF